MINRSTIHTFKSYMQLFEKMNTINYVISFTGVVRATMDIFSSDASWIVETEGDITEKTDATHSTGSHVFFQIVIIFGSNTVLRMMLNYPFHPIVAVVPGLIPPAGAAPPYKPNICVRTIDIPFLSTCPCHLSMHFLSTPSIASSPRSGFFAAPVFLSGEI